MTSRRLGWCYEVWKRCLDAAVSVVGLVLASPILAVIAIAIKVTSAGPVLFVQERAGRDRRAFSLHKFRTMLDLRGEDGALLPDRLRLTRLGIFLRRTSLDELPQLWDVLRADLSLVGPRPLPLHYLPYFRDDELRRLQVKPGITGWAQIHGRNASSWDRRLADDVWYVENRSVRLDLVILVRTIRYVVRADGFMVDPQGAMQNLDEERRGDGSTPSTRTSHGSSHTLG